MSDEVFERFHPQVAGWFREVFAQPTVVQQQAWTSISQGNNALVVAPTGSGKTLAAFFWALNNLVERAGQISLPGVVPDELAHSQSSDDDARGVKVLYISPLKALGVDIERNLRVPLKGISRVAEKLGKAIPEISIAVRSGDTPSAERARQLRRPPDILITTPESAYLMLTGKAHTILRTVDTVIVDEIHAIAGTKRGAHLSLSLERLARIANDPQRIGLSATVRPLETVANFLGGNRSVDIISPPAQKEWDLQVRVPVEDMADLPIPEKASTIGEVTVDDPYGFSGSQDSVASDSALPVAKSIWPFIEDSVYESIMASHSTLVFVNSRRTAERLTSRINEIYAQQHDPDSLSPATRRDPAQLMKQTDVAGKAPAIIARAHHGSVSKDERATTESMLKQGELKAVVATSSLELGIDMGAVDQVIQVESPPSVASALQRVGRAGHTVGAVSKGEFYPQHRSDLVHTAVTVERMRQGMIEEISVPSTPLDVLVQQTIAAVAVEDLDAQEWFNTVRRAFPYRFLDREVFDAVLDLASGIYPSTDFSELKPRIVYDRVTNQLSARKGAQRIAVTNGGTIPDRGMFGVFLAGASGPGPSTSAAKRGSRRVGELDEEMVYESRVGDVFTLGASSWRIEDITRDQVLVSPAPGHTGRLPFWSGDQVGRPYELGLALGAFRRQVAADPSVLKQLPLEPNASGNLTAYLREQREATGIIPDEATLVLERFRDEMGDWRVILHTPFGKGVNAAWALAVGARIAENTGMDAQAVAGDDGIVLRLPDGDVDPDASLFSFEADDIDDIVTREVGNSALFASRFRECASRALLLPNYRVGQRSPLWQQRQKAEQLLDIARKYPTFPIILETVRECLQDVYDLPALKEVLGELRHRGIRIAEVTTEQPSPFASSLLFNYTGAFMYEGDSPLAEKRAAALSLDPALLAKLLGTVELRELLDPEIIKQVHARRQRTDHPARNAEELADTLRRIGPIPTAQLSQWSHIALDDAIAELGRRVMLVRIAGREHLAQASDAALLRDGLGIPLPPGVAANTETISDALVQLVSRWARARGPFSVEQVCQAFGVSTSSAWTTLQVLLARDDLIEGHFSQGVEVTEYCAAEVLKQLRSRSLAAARNATQPVSTDAFARFLLQWHQLRPLEASGESSQSRHGGLDGVDGVFAVIEQLAGVRLPASAWENLIFASRVPDYQPRMLDELTASGEVLIIGAGQSARHDPWLRLVPAEYAAQLVPDPAPTTLSGLQERIMAVLGRGGGFLFADLLDQVNNLSAETTPESSDPTAKEKAAAIALYSAGQEVSAQQLREALWELVDYGLVSPDSFSPLRTRLKGSSGQAHKTKPRPRRSRVRMGRTSFAQRHHASPARTQTPPDMNGRWAQTIAADTEETARSVAWGEAWLDRYGIVTRGSVVAEAIEGGFARAYKVLSEFEAAGKAMRGYFIEGLGAAQFSTTAIISRLRALDDDTEGWPHGTKPALYVVAACDPANPYGASLNWPARDVADTASQTTNPASSPARSAGALVVLADGLCLAHVTRGGKTLTTFIDALPDGIDETEDPVTLLVDSLNQLVANGHSAPVIIDKINGVSALQSSLLPRLRAAGAGITPKGVRISGRRSRSASTSAVAANRGGSGGLVGRSISQALDEDADETKGDTGRV